MILKKNSLLSGFPIKHVLGFISTSLLICGMAWSQPGGYVATVSAEKVKIQDIVEEFSVVGKLVADKASWLDVEMLGLVITQEYKKGLWVKKGQVLLTLDKKISEYQLKAFEAQLKELTNETKLIESILKKSKTLHKEGHVTSEQIEKEETAHKSMQAKIDALKANVDLLKHNIEKHKLLAPYDGLIIEEKATLGQYIQPGMGALKILKLDKVIAEFEFPEIRLSQLDKKSDLNLKLDALPNEKIISSLEAILPGEKAGNRMLLLRYKFDNKSKSILPGMGVRANLKMKAIKDALLVPKDSVSLGGPASFVYTVSDKSTAVQVQVEVLRYYKKYAVVKGKLTSEDRVVTRGNEMLQPGVSLKIVDPSKK
jgi:membrane fusion protein, multidrug efflux system